MKIYLRSKISYQRKSRVSEFPVDRFDNLLRNDIEIKIDMFL